MDNVNTIIKKLDKIIGLLEKDNNSNPNEVCVKIIEKFISIISWLFFGLLSYNIVHFGILYFSTDIEIWTYTKSVLNISLTNTEINSFPKLSLLFNQLANIILTSFIFGGVFLMIYEVNEKKPDLDILLKNLFKKKEILFIMKKTKWLIGLIVLIGIIWVINYKWFAEATNTANTEFVWGGPKNLAFLPIIAQENGYFSENNIKTKRNDVQTGKITMDALQTGDIDFGILVETNISFSQFGNGKPLKVIAIIQEKYDDAIVVDSTKIKSPRDLIGKTIGITPATTSHSFLVKYLKSKGISIDSCTILNMSPPAIQAGLINHTLDAGSIWQPFRYNVMKADTANVMIEFNDKEVYKGYSLIVVTEEFAKEHKEDIRKFLQSLALAEKYISEHTENSQKILAEQISVPFDVLQSVWNEYNIKLGLDKSLKNAFQTDVQWIKESVKEFKDKPEPSFDKVLMPEFLLEIDKNRVNGF